LNIITILGSPRKHGNTGIVLNAFEKLISGKHTVEHITIPRLAVNGCLGCDACQRVKDKHGCIQKDGINAGKNPLCRYGGLCLPGLRVGFPRTNESADGQTLLFCQMEIHK